MPSLSAAARVCIIGVRRRAKRRFVRIKALRSLGSRNSSAITRRSSFGRLSIGMVGSIALVGMGWGHRKFIIIPPSSVVSSLLGALWLFFGGDWYYVVWYGMVSCVSEKEKEGKGKREIKKELSYSESKSPRFSDRSEKMNDGERGSITKLLFPPRKLSYQVAS